MDSARKTSIYALFQLGVPLAKVEELYGTDDAHLAARNYVAEADEQGGENSREHKLAVGLALLQQSKKSLVADETFIKPLISALADDPDDESLMDPVTLCLIKDPVVLSSGFVVDRETVLDEVNNKMRFTKCPFSRETLERSVYPLPLLRKKILAWRISQLNACHTVATMLINKAKWDEAKQVLDIADNLLDMQGNTEYFTVASKLAKLHRRLPDTPVEGIVQRYKHLFSNATKPEQTKFLRNVAEEGLEEVTSLVDSLSLETNSSNGKKMSSLQQQAYLTDSVLWLALHPWLDQEENRDAWNDLRLPLAQKLLRIAKIAKSKDIKRLRFNVWNLLTAQAERDAFLQQEGVSSKEMMLQAIAPDFDTTGWTLVSDGDTSVASLMQTRWPKIPWIEPEQGHIRTGGQSSFLEYDSDLSPRPGEDWTVEVAFKPSSLQPESYKNSIFSQHGFETGWEIRACPTAIELVFSTTGLGGQWHTHNEFRAKPTNGGVRENQWTHCFVVYENATKRLMIYINGSFSASKHIQGEFRRASELPRIGQNPCWSDERFFNGEVAFARVEHKLRCPLSELTNFASNLAESRFMSLGESSTSDESSQQHQVIQMAPFCNNRHWRVRWSPHHPEEMITLDHHGGFSSNGQYVFLQPTNPISIAWKDGTIHAMHSFEDGVITWTVSNPNTSWIPSARWEIDDVDNRHYFGAFRDNARDDDDDDDDSHVENFLGWSPDSDDDDDF
uniref:U-box domain-containing protein n=1 Tax=Helicotheca tamesis TaxID=374047 RepID=A0A7S2IAH4_9STRA|mmetsp:Transcript_7150/g.9689  ORF Transcript_7150/g.9689 Transcript_7150/m.9689 type:complete len:730 (+) Transcript_7150:223-2412(+)|eukprot:CAMPEP_0185728218 /NCGR_PEP_ID=MMETSP1171-20130828/3639_1 /TAXON_ID=374046 /ORGANISM="Helicotheca tamensis, Strain CCMP826" /LENGTH=729 /DNA_ID=CAMNT_0028396899 /DNA_START=117 /DNA_END=2306 /DNA_ORIENTATION=-